MGRLLGRAQRPCLCQMHGSPYGARIAFQCSLHPATIQPSVEIASVVFKPPFGNIYNTYDRETRREPLLRMHFFTRIRLRSLTVSSCGQTSPTDAFPCFWYHFACQKCMHPYVYCLESSNDLLCPAAGPRQRGVPAGAGAAA